MKIYTTIPQSAILSAVTKLESYIKCTYGKAGRGILIDNGLYQSVVDDGFLALEEFELEDELENTVILFIKEATRNTNKKAGDATTTSILILCALVKEALSNNYSLNNDLYGIGQDLKKGLEIAVKQIRKLSKKVTTIEDLKQIALNAYNNPTLAEMVAEIVYKIGVDGVVSIEDSESMDTSYDITVGMTIDRGFSSQQMIPDSGKVELINPAIIITDQDVRDWNELSPVINKVVAGGYKSMLLICESVTDSAFNGMITNGLIAVKAPGFGNEKIEVLKDLAIVLGGKVSKLSSFSIDDIGTAKRVVVQKEETNFVQGRGTEEQISERVKVIKENIKGSTPVEKARMEERVAKLLGGVAVIKVGALTNTELIATKMKLDDTIHTTQLALKEGKILGGGVSLMQVKSGCLLLDNALKYPREVLEENGKKYIDKDVYDSTGSVIVALESAISVASDLIVSGGIITTKIKKDERV